MKAPAHRGEGWEEKVDQVRLYSGAKYQMVGGRPWRGQSAR